MMLWFIDKCISVCACVWRELYFMIIRDKTITWCRCFPRKLISNFQETDTNRLMLIDCVKEDKMFLSMKCFHSLCTFVERSCFFYIQIYGSQSMFTHSLYHYCKISVGESLIFIFNKKLLVFTNYTKYKLDLSM